jgi:hypothetical protein
MEYGGINTKVEAVVQVAQHLFANKSGCLFCQFHTTFFPISFETFNIICELQ